MSHDVFICHSSKDHTIATAICSRLEQHRIRCWIAPRDVIPGSEYAQAIVEAISTAKLTVLVFSDNSNHSVHVRREIERTASHGIPILPFRLEEVTPSPSLEYFISDAHWLDALTPPLEQHLDHLVGTVRLLLDRETTAHEATSAPAAPPAAPHPSPGGITAPAVSPGKRRRPPVWALGLIGFAALLVVAGGGWLIASRAGSSPTPTPPQGSVVAEPSETPIEPTMVKMTALKAGDCLQAPAGQSWESLEFWPDPTPVVPCDSPHSAEVYFVGSLGADDAAFPGQAALDERGSTRCLEEFEEYVGIPFEESRLAWSGWGPAAESWNAGDRQHGCIAYAVDGQELEQSIRGLRQ